MVAVEKCIDLGGEVFGGGSAELGGDDDVAVPAAQLH
jgi:hypothetical protein